MTRFEVPEPIINSPYVEPAHYWALVEGEPPKLQDGRRPAMYYFRPPSASSEAQPSEDVGTAIELKLVNRIRSKVAEWRSLALQGEGGVTRTTMELLNYWRRDGRQFRLFFAQLEAAETIIFLTEARRDFLQGIDIPWDEPSEQQKGAGYSAFRRYACKMATGTGKTTVMAMLAAWSILNKVAHRQDSRFSDVILVLCPNVTIRNRLRELNPETGEASIYQTRDLVPAHMMPDLRQGRLLVTNWHIFELQQVQAGGVSAKVSRAGVPQRVTEKITIGEKTTTARGTRYLKLADFKKQVAAGLLTVLDEERDKKGNLAKVVVESTKYVESETAWIQRVLGRDIGGKQNILVFNDEAHHAYRIRRDEPDVAEEDNIGEEDEEREGFFKEATVWVEGLDRIHKQRQINFCVDFSATPYFLGRVGQATNRVFPWVISDFGLTDAIESGLVKIPQLAVRDTTGAEIPGYFNIWRWILPKLTTTEKGGRKGIAKPEAILKYAHTPIVMLGGLWNELRQAWEEASEDPRPPVFILVCKNTKISKVVYEWLGEGKGPPGIPPANIAALRNNGNPITIRVDSKVIHETDTEGSASIESAWMRATLDTVGKSDWPRDRQGRPVYPDGFEELAAKLGRPLHPPGRDVRCIVSVGMLTEGWDCNTVTHIVGLRPFMSQLLCEQVVGRGLRRASYEVGDNDRMTEEIAKIFGVPFEIIPFKETKKAAERQIVERHHVHAIPEKEAFKITFPRVEGFQQAIRNRVSVDWDTVPSITLDPTSIPPEVQMKAGITANRGRPSLLGPGNVVTVDLNPFRRGKRLQELEFELARDLTREYAQQPTCEAPAHVLFPQMVQIFNRYLKENVLWVEPSNLLDVFCSPYYGWVIERLVGAIKPDARRGEVPELPRYEQSRGPGSTSDVDFWTSKEVREVLHCHLNYMVADTKKWEQSAAYVIDNHESVDAFVKNAGLGFSIPYFHNGRHHDYVPDFIIRLKDGRNLVLETKGFDPLAEVKRQGAERWTAAVNADGRHGQWLYRVARAQEEVRRILDSI